MNRLLLYNPGNDAALASGREQYTPPRAARLMAEAGTLLPLWWADDEDYILAPASMIDEAERLKSKFGLGGTLGVKAGLVAEPWGWSAATRVAMERLGCVVPTAEAVDRLRKLSHRRTAIEIHRRIGTPDELMPVEATSVEQVREACRRFGRGVVKQPWSCSGRGVFMSHKLPDEMFEKIIESAIRKQGSVVVEPFYDACAEMAALFYSDGAGKVEIKGYSTFASSPAGAYEGNMVASQERILEICAEDVRNYASRLSAILSELVGCDYRGWLGIDMLRHADGLNPCMEMNLRMTMGVVAMFIAEKGIEGTLMCTTSPVDSDLRLSTKDAAVQFVVRRR